ncbi:MAG: OmpH family outer membrane protein [Phycisphaerae bacterium]|nr:OmpH family outer membrane protein [Phycisphaerae bacterium]
MKSASLVRTTLAALAVAIALASTPIHAAAQAAGTKVAVANAGKIFNEIREKKDWEQKTATDSKTIQDTAFQKQQKIKSLQDQRDNLRPDSPQYAQKNSELMSAKIDLEVYAQIQTADAQRQNKQKTKEIFDKIVNSVAEVATSKGVDLVLADSHPDLPDDFLEKANIDQVRALLGQRNVLFSSPQVDITQDVITAMDAKYTSGK